MERIIFHIDVNSAFLSWTAIWLLKNKYPVDIRTIPAVIGGNEKERHGIVLAASIPAKKLGIRTPEVLQSARKKCPILKTFPPNYHLYKFCSNKLFNYLKNRFNELETFSIDECYIDYSSYKNIYGDPLEYARLLKDEIKNKFGFTVNIGIGNNKLTAKMASDLEKPDKVNTIFDSEVRSKMWPLPVKDLYMVGKSTQEKLIALNINTIGDLANFDLNILQKKLHKLGFLIWEFANGIDNSLVVINPPKPKGIGASRTLIEDTDNINTLKDQLKNLTIQVVNDLKKQNCYAKTITVHIKNNKFVSRSWQTNIKNATNDVDIIINIAKELLINNWDKELVRLIGIRVSNFCDKFIYQTSLFEDNEKVIKNIENDFLIKKINKKLDTGIIKIAK